MEQQIQQSINEQINLGFLYLLEDAISLERHPFIKKLDKIHPSLKESRTFIYDCIRSLPEILEKTGEEKYALTEKILDNKNELIRQFHLAYSYVTELTTFSSMLEECYQLQQFQEIDRLDLDYHGFYHDCRHFLFDDAAGLDRDSKVRQVLKSLPIRMTKDRFFDYVRESIDLIDIEDTENSVGRFFIVLKQQFLGSTIEGYDTFYPEAARIIYSLFETDFKKTSIDEMNQLAEEANHLSNTLQELNEYISILYDTYNHLTVLLILENLELGFIFNQHVAYTDLYKIVCNMIDPSTSDEEKEIFSETVTDLLNEHIHQKKENYFNTTEELFKQISSKGYDQISPSIQHLLDTEGLIKMYLEMNIYDQFSYGRRTEEDELSYEVLAEYIHEFIDFVKSNLTNMPVIERKTRMRNILGFLPPFWNEDQIMEYIQTSIEYSSTEELKTLAVSRIGNLMEDYGYFQEDHECNHDPDEHVHDEHCHHDHH